MLDRSVLKWGGASAMLGAVLGVIFNLLHPRSSEALDNAAAELELVRDSDIWLFVHYMLGWSLAFGLIGLLAIGWSFTRGRAAGWARIATGTAIGGAVVAFITVSVDGMASDLAAQSVTDAPGDAAVVAAAESVTRTSLALFTATIASFFGLTPVLFGVTTLASDEHPRWLGALALGAGLLGLLVASIQYLSGPSQIVTNVLFTIASVGFTLWSFVMGLRLWQGRVGEPGPPGDLGGVREPVGV